MLELPDLSLEIHPTLWSVIFILIKNLFFLIWCELGVENKIVTEPHETRNLLRLNYNEKESEVKSMAADHISKYSGPTAEEGLRRILFVNEDQFAWIIIGPDPAKPVDLNTMTTEGNYVVYNYINGHPDFDIKPMNVHVYFGDTRPSGEKIYMQVIQCINGYYQRLILVNADGTIETDPRGWQIASFNGSAVVIHRGETPPPNPQESTFWLYVNNTTNEFILKIWDGTNWVPVIPADSMTESVYDPRKVGKPVDTYIDEEYKKVDSYQNMLLHMEDNTLHIDEAYRTTMNEALSTEQLNQYKTDMLQYVIDTIATVLENKKFNEANTKVTELETRYNTHVANNDASGLKHVTPEKVAEWNSKAPGNHSHLSDNKVEIDASSITSGVLNIDRMPPEAFTKVYVVDSTDAMIAHAQANNVPNGTVYHIPVTGNPVGKWYRLKDKTKVASLADGYLDFSTDPNGMVIDFNRIIMPSPVTVVTLGITDLFTKETLDAKVSMEIRGLIDDSIKTLVEPYVDKVVFEMMGTYGYSRNPNIHSYNIPRGSSVNFREAILPSSKRLYEYSLDRYRHMETGMYEYNKVTGTSIEETAGDLSDPRRLDGYMYRPLVASPTTITHSDSAGRKKLRPFVAGQTCFFVHDKVAMTYLNADRREIGYMYYITAGEVTPHYITFEELFQELFPDDDVSQFTITDITPLYSKGIVFELSIAFYIHTKGIVNVLFTSDNKLSVSSAYIYNMYTGMTDTTYLGRCQNAVPAKAKNTSTSDYSIKDYPLEMYGFYTMKLKSQTGTSVSVDFTAYFTYLGGSYTGPCLGALTSNTTMNKSEYDSIISQSNEAGALGIPPMINFFCMFDPDNLTYENYNRGKSNILLGKINGTRAILIFLEEAFGIYENATFTGDSGYYLMDPGGSQRVLDPTNKKTYPFIQTYHALQCRQFIAGYGKAIVGNRKAYDEEDNNHSTEKAYDIDQVAKGLQTEDDTSCPYMLLNVLGVWDMINKTFVILPININSTSVSMEEDKFANSYIYGNGGLAFSFDTKNNTTPAIYDYENSFNRSDRAVLYNDGTVMYNNRRTDPRFIESQITDIYHFGYYHEKYILIVGTGYTPKNTTVDSGENLSQYCDDKIYFFESGNGRDWSIAKIMPKHDHSILLGNRHTLKDVRDMEPVVVVKDDIAYFYYSDMMSNAHIETRIVSLNTYQDMPISTLEALTSYVPTETNKTKVKYQHRLARTFNKYRTTDTIPRLTYDIYPVSFKGNKLYCKKSYDGIRWEDKIYEINNVNWQRYRSETWGENGIEPHIGTTRPEEMIGRYTVKGVTDQNIVVMQSMKVSTNDYYPQSVIADTFVVSDMLLISEEEIIFILRVDNNDQGTLKDITVRGVKNLYNHIIVHYKDGVSNACYIPPVTNMEKKTYQYDYVELLPIYEPMSDEFIMPIFLNLYGNVISGEQTVNFCWIAKYDYLSNTIDTPSPHATSGSQPIQKYGGHQCEYVGTRLAGVKLTTQYVAVGETVDISADANYEPGVSLTLTPTSAYSSGDKIFECIDMAESTSVTNILSILNIVKDALHLPITEQLNNKACILDVKYREQTDRKMTDNGKSIPADGIVKHPVIMDDSAPTSSFNQVAMLVLFMTTPNAESTNYKPYLAIVEFGTSGTRRYCITPHIIPIDSYRNTSSSMSYFISFMTDFWDYDFERSEPGPRVTLHSQHADVYMRYNPVSNASDLVSRQNPSLSGSALLMEHSDVKGIIKPDTLYTNYQDQHLMNYFYAAPGKAENTQQIVRQDVTNYSYNLLPTHMTARQTIKKDGYSVFGLNQMAIAPDQTSQVTYLYRYNKAVNEGVKTNLEKASNYMNLINSFFDINEGFEAGEPETPMP